MTGLLGPARADETPPPPKKASDFTLKDLDGKDRKLSEFEGKWVVLEWTNYDCPFVKKHYLAEHKQMQGLQKKYTDKGVIWLSICSSAPGKQGNKSPEEWKKAIADNGAAPTAVLLDTDGKVGKDYGARNTPEIWIVNGKREIAYHGAADDTPDWHADVTKAKNYIVAVLDAVLDGKEAPVKETKPYGCSIKYAE